jgi:SAM-dependent methyltransferase
MNTDTHQNPPSPKFDPVFSEWCQYVSKSLRTEFGIHHLPLAEEIARKWYYADSRLDFHAEEWELLKASGIPHGPVLDLAAGMGTAFARGLEKGIPMMGLEPDATKTKMSVDHFPGLRGRWVRGVGENLPYRDAAFAAILSWQTLEHVQSPEAVLREMLRVLKPGGFLHLRCPDYRGTYEGHYLLPWLPVLPRSFARIWLRCQRRPALGLQSITYVTAPSMKRALNLAALELGVSLEWRDRQKERVIQRLQEKGWPTQPWMITLVQGVRYAAALFRREWTVDWVITRLPPSIHR